MIEFIRADHIHITVSPERLAEAKLFYTNIIGLTLIERPKELDASKGYWFQMGDIQLHIGVEPQLPKSGRHTAFEIKNVAAARKHLEINGVEILEEPFLPGRNRFAFRDPLGNKIELLEMEE